MSESLRVKDLTDNANGVHAINIMIDQIIESIKNYYDIEINTIRNSPIVSVEDNYKNLYYPSDTITMSSRYTRWVDEKRILRTQTTSGVPNLLKTINKDDGIYLLPGIVYRRDVVDKTHVGEPHQLDIWRVSNKKRYNREDLLELVGIIINTILPNVEWRYNETNHYYTKNGIEIEVNINGSWLEILECGEILPRLLDDCGLDSTLWSGLAMGIGLDRSVMIRKGISDIRILRSQDERICSQMSNLDKYKEISKYNSTTIDLSVAIDNNIDDEQLGDIVRNLMGVDVSLIEQIKIKSETKYSDLPQHVSKRLGMNESMKNVLLSITIQSLDRNISKDESHDICKYLYGNIHQGTVGYI